MWRRRRWRSASARAARAAAARSDSRGSRRARTASRRTAHVHRPLACTARGAVLETSESNGDEKRRKSAMRRFDESATSPLTFTAQQWRIESLLLKYRSSCRVLVCANTAQQQCSARCVAWRGVLRCHVARARTHTHTHTQMHRKVKYERAKSTCTRGYSHSYVPSLSAYRLCMRLRELLSSALLMPRRAPIFGPAHSARARVAYACAAPRRRQRTLRVLCRLLIVRAHLTNDHL